MTTPRDQGSLDQHVLFANRLSAWICRAGVSDGDAVGDLAVGFADVVYASATAAGELEALLSLDPTVPADAELALKRLGYLRALFLTEIKWHVEDLERRWDELEGQLSARAPDDPDDETAE